MALLCSARALRSDPVLNHNFVVSLIDTSSTLAILGSAALSAIFDVALGGFSECSGLEMSLKTEDFREGGNNGAVLHFPSSRRVGDDHAQEGHRRRPPCGTGTTGSSRDGQAPRRRDRPADRPTAAAQHLVFPARPADQVHRPAAERHPEQRRHRVDRDRPRGHLPGALRRRRRVAASVGCGRCAVRELSEPCRTCGSMRSSARSGWSTAIRCSAGPSWSGSSRPCSKPCAADRRDDESRRRDTRIGDARREEDAAIADDAARRRRSSASTGTAGASPRTSRSSTTRPSTRSRSRTRSPRSRSRASTRRSSSSSAARPRS